MKITVLSENTTRGPQVSPEFGLSLHIACDSGSILFDSGCSDNFAGNARKLGVNLSGVDVAVLSHGHFDHANGFGAFIAANDHAPIYAQAGFDGDCRKGADEYIGIAPELKESDRFQVVDGSLELSGGLSILNYPGTTAIHPIESEDMLVKTDEGLVADSFSHEHYLLVQEGDVRLLVTGCSHKGIANIMNWTKAFNITHVVGGFHLMGLKPGDRARFDALAEELLAYDAMYYTGHCTGIEQYAQLKCRMGDRVAYLGTGQVLELG